MNNCRRYAAERITVNSMKKWTRKKYLDDYFALFGSFGRAVGKADIQTDGKSTTVSGSVGGCYMESTFFEDKSGVTVRTGKIRNESDEDITLSTALYRYVFDGGEYEIYTQFNGWQNESIGGWQPLVTSVTAFSETPRSCSSATPLLALYNVQTGRGMAINLIPNGAWELSARRATARNESTEVVAEAGNLARKQVTVLKPGEELAFPTVLCHVFTNKLDLDGWKLQRYSHRNIPQKTMPVIYNTWLYRFDKISYGDVSRQIPKAAELGCEYFVIDAGWFGNGAGWQGVRGDWKENQTAKLCGKMKTLADEVRAHGMKFGFWLETESAGRDSEILRDHLDWFIYDAGLYYLDFTNKEAANTMYETVCSLVDLYGAEFMKFDYNQDLYADKTLTSFCDYHNSYAEYVRRIRERYPELYLQCCASGGMRTDLKNCMLFDSYWLSDDQSPYEGLRLVKETVKRLAPQRIERWACLTSFASTQPAPQDKLLANDDWTWGRLASVHESYLKAFLTGAPIGFSCDLTLLSGDTFDMLKNLLKNSKKSVPHIGRMPR